MRIPGVEVVAAEVYLTDLARGDLRRTRVLNLSRSNEYQGWGYYVSLLAEARAHRPFPTLSTLQDLTRDIVSSQVTREVEALVERSLRDLKGETFELSVYFGRNVARCYDRLAAALFDAFPAPLLRAHFERSPRRWSLTRVRLLDAEEVPEAHLPFLGEQAEAYLAGARRRRRSTPAARFDLAVLHDPEEANPPSNKRALRRFRKAAAALGIAAEPITPSDLGRVHEFDALFLRQTTSVDDHTYQVARQAARDDMVVLDDPESILRCTNKVYMAEAFARARVPMPTTMVVHEGNRARVEAELGLPCVLKRPDSSFSMGVRKVETSSELAQALDAMLQDSRLVVAQGFVQSRFDWRVGVLGGEPLYLCKYHLVKGHWTIQSTGPRGGTRYGDTETLPLVAAPQGLIETALHAARTMGLGLYGVDLKQTDEGFVVMEVNDNPNLDSGVEDLVLGEELYRRVMEYFVTHLERQMAWPTRPGRGGKP